MSYIHATTMTYSDWFWVGHRYWIEGQLLDKEKPTDPDVYEYWINSTFLCNIQDYTGWINPANYPASTNMSGNNYDLTWKQIITIHIPNFYNEIKVTKK
jgi:hypothetical protein